jgi:hypothetical protein
MEFIGIVPTINITSPDPAASPTNSLSQEQNSQLRQLTPPPKFMAIAAAKKQGESTRVQNACTRRTLGQ